MRIIEVPTIGIPEITVDVYVRFSETDAMGVVHHAAYVIWLELGRAAWMNAVGVPYIEIANGGHHLAVTRLEVEYRGSARFGDTLKLTTGVTTLRSRQLSFVYRIHNEIGELLLTGHTDHICVDLAGHSAKIPESILARLEAGQAVLSGAAV